MAHLEAPQTLSPDTIQQAAGAVPAYSADLSKRGLIALCSFKQFPKLQTLSLAYNRLAALTPEGLFDALKDLKELRLTDNSLKALSEIRNAGLLALYADFNLVEELEDISRLKKLKILKLDGNPLISLGSLADLPELEVLGLSRCHLRTIDRLPAVQELDLSYNSLKSAPVPASLRVLSFSFNKLTDLSFLAPAQSLERLELDGNRLETLETIPRLESLQDFSCSANQVYMFGAARDVGELLPALTSLDISSNNLYSKLELLCLARSQIFYELDLRGNPCSDYAEFESEMAGEFPHLRTLNGRELARMTPAQRELKSLRDASDVNLEEEKEAASARPAFSRGGPLPAATKPRPHTTFARIKTTAPSEEAYRKNFLEDLNTSVLQLKQTFKAAMSRIKATLQSIFALPGERSATSSTGFLFPTQERSNGLSVVDEMDEDKSALDQSLQVEEDRWFADELRKSQAGPASLQRKFEAYESSGQSPADQSRSSHKVMKHKYIKLEKTMKPQTASETEEPPLPLRPSSRHKQKLLQAKEWLASQDLLKS